MKTMNPFSRLLLLGALLLSVSLPATAQGPQGPGHGPRNIENIKTELGLTDEQATQFEALKKAHHQEMRALKSSEEAPDREKIKALRKNHRAQMSEILSPDQLEKLKEMPRHPHGHHGHEGKAERKAMNKQIRPLLKQQRLKLETSLTAAEKTEIEGLRSELKALRPQKKALHAEGKTIREAGNKPDEAHKAQRQELKAQKQAIVEKAMVIGKAHEAEIKALHEEIKPQLEAIRPEHDGQPKHKKRMHPLAKFVLMNPNGKGQAAESDLEVDEAEVYPNPSRASNTLRYTTKASGPVQIDLLDKEGQLVKTVFSGERTAGSHALPVNTSDLNSNVYYYRITSKEGVTMKRFSTAQ